MRYWILVDKTPTGWDWSILKAGNGDERGAEQIANGTADTFEVAAIVAASRAVVLHNDES